VLSPRQPSTRVLYPAAQRQALLTPRQAGGGCRGPPYRAISAAVGPRSSTSAAIIPKLPPDAAAAPAPPISIRPSLRRSPSPVPWLLAPGGLLADAPTGLLSTAGSGLWGLVLCILMAGLPFLTRRALALLVLACGLLWMLWRCGRSGADRTDQPAGCCCWLGAGCATRLLAGCPPRPKVPAEAAQPYLRRLCPDAPVAGELSPAWWTDRGQPCWLVSCCVGDRQCRQL